MRTLILLFSSLLAGTLAAVTASAGDGVVEINAAAAQQGGITAGDDPGFPVTLSRGGSYRLTGDLLSSSQAVPVVEITADRVSLDLAGFTVGACLSGGFCATGNATAITASGRSDVRIHDGVVQNAGSTCVFAGSNAVLENLRVSGCDGGGVGTGSHGRVVGVTVEDVGGVGVSLQIGSILQDSVVTGSASYGVSVYFNALLVDTMIEENASGAVVAQGFSGASRGGYRGCIITRNGEEEDQQIATAMRDLGGNVCGNDTTCP